MVSTVQAQRARGRMARSAVGHTTDRRKNDQLTLRGHYSGADRDFEIGL